MDIWIKDGSTECGHVFTLCSYLCFVYKIAVWNIFNTVGFIDCIKLLRYQNRLYHRTEKSIHRSALFLFLLLSCGDIEVNPGPRQADKGFSIYQQNLRGLRNNKEVLEDFINQKNIKIFGITETLLLSSTPKSFLLIRGYTFESKDRIKTGGGITVYVKEGITYLRRNDRPSNTSKHLNKNFEQKLANILSTISLLNKKLSY